MIEALKEDFPIKVLCETLGIARSSYYVTASQKPGDRELLKDIEKITEIRADLLQNIDFPNRGELIMRLNKR